MYQFLFLSECRPNLSVISAAFIAFGRSCRHERNANMDSTCAIEILSRMNRQAKMIAMAFALQRQSYLFVSENEQYSITKFVFGEHSHQFFAGFPYSFSIIWVDHKDQSLCVLEVMPPQGTNFVLSTNIPHSEWNILIFDSFDVEACGDKWTDRLLSMRAKVGGVQAQF